MDISDNQRRITRLSRRLGRLLQLCIFTLPLVPVVFWLGYNHMPQVMHENVFPGSFPATLPLNGRLIALAGSLPATVVLVLALSNLKRLFALYEQGIYFQAENVRLFRTLARLALFSVIADVVNKTVIELARTINNPSGERLLSISLSSDHLKLMIVASIIMVIGMVIDEGRRINDEIELTV
jgi:hypothetical protein